MSHKPNWQLLGGVRFVLALIVAVCHTVALANDGTYPYYIKLGPTSCVQLFLVISGFSMAASFAKEPRGFGWRRFWRIAPLYWLGLFLSLVPFWIHGPNFAMDFSYGFKQQPWVWTALQALWLQPLFAHSPDTNGALWTLPVEAAFYAFVPLIARMGQRWLLALMGLSIIWTLWLPAINTRGFSPFAYLFWCFGVGWLLYQHRGNWRVQLAVVVVPVLLIQFRHLEDQTWSGAVAAVALLAIAFNGKIQLSRTAAKVADYLGDLSFPLYVVHCPIAVLCSCAGFLGVSALLPSLAVAVLALHLVDRPLRAIGRKNTKAPTQNETRPELAAV